MTSLESSQDQELHGWFFDFDSAWQLASALGAKELRHIEELLRNRHPYVEGPRFTPKRTNRRTGYVEGATLTRLKELNCSSRDHIAWILQTFHGWKPKQLTPTGKPIIDEVILKEIGTEVATMFLQILTIKKMLGMIQDGENAWMKLSTTSNRIHHHCSVATNTHRCAHRRPNLGQVPSDERFRKLFIPSPGLCMVGADLSGIELRMLAHYLARYDGGRYARAIYLRMTSTKSTLTKLESPERQVKTVTYAFLYGAGDEKIGHSYDPQLSATKAKAKGKEIRAAYVDAVDGLGDLLSAVKKASEGGSIRSIDRRKIDVDSTSQRTELPATIRSGCHR